MNEPTFSRILNHVANNHLIHRFSDNPESFRLLRADRIYLGMLAARGWSHWAIPPEQLAERARLWKDAMAQAEACAN